MRAELPPPSPDAATASQALTAIIAAEIEAGGGWMSFARYMELALYAPGLGYYSGGSRKFGAEGDFLTAPELTPLFGQALARQITQILQSSAPLVIEAGAGSGRLAADLLPALEALGALPERYCILELSGELRARQQATLSEHAPEYLSRVEWLDELPEKFSGCLIGNEVLDAMPTHAVRWTDAGIDEGGVCLDDERLAWGHRPAGVALSAAARALAVNEPYHGEISLAVRAWVSELARRLDKGALLLLDYGLPRRELYLPQRDGGTVRCHYRHRAHDDPFWYPGLSDITSHVDFTAVAEAGFDAGLSVLGYTAQANFLINCGIGELLLEKVGSGGTAAQAGLKAQGAVNILLSPNEMGELFKVIAMGRGLDATAQPLIGFKRGDRTHAL
jgi:SAM-dependent MidA family methyltransferase